MSYTTYENDLANCLDIFTKDGCIIIIHNDTPETRNLCPMIETKDGITLFDVIFPNKTEFTVKDAIDFAKKTFGDFIVHFAQLTYQNTTIYIG